MGLDRQIAEAVLALMIERGLVVPRPEPQPSVADDALLTVEQAAERLNTTIPYVRQLYARGELSYVRFGERGIRIKVSDLQALIERRRSA